MARWPAAVLATAARARRNGSATGGAARSSTADGRVREAVGRSRAAIDRQRRGFTVETGPLTRLLAEVVLRPPDLRHLDAAFLALGTSPHGETSLRLAISDLFATRCVSCGRTLPIDEVEWQGDEPARI